MNSFKINPVIHSLRKEYEQGVLSKETVLDNPFHQFEAWLDESLDKGNHHANAMVLSTVDKDLMPDSRVVLLRNISYGGFTFYTNYKSKKAKDLAQNKKACLLFFWPESERQVRVEGEIELLPAHESDQYFNSRPFESQVGAWASTQSQVIKSRSELEMNFEKELENYKGKTVPRPPHWGGYVLIPSKFEFWQGRSSRLHDRIQFTLNKEKNNWTIDRLMP